MTQPILRSPANDLRTRACVRSWRLSWRRCLTFGVLLGMLSVAYAIVHMLPTDLLLNMGSAHGLAMVFFHVAGGDYLEPRLWYFGLPASSSHTLIGAIIGIGLTNAMMTTARQWWMRLTSKVINIFGSLIISPIVGLVFAGGLIFLLPLLGGTKKRARIHLTPAERERKTARKSRRSGRVSR